MNLEIFTDSNTWQTIFAIAWAMLAGGGGFLYKKLLESKKTQRDTSQDVLLIKERCTRLEEENQQLRDQYRLLEKLFEISEKQREHETAELRKRIAELEAELQAAYAQLQKGLNPECYQSQN